MTRSNEPAYPTDAETLRHSGLTIREHSAAMAMMGLLAARALADTHPKRITAMSCEFADALLAELERTKP